MTRSMSTVSNDLPAKPKNKLILNRDSNKMSPNRERIGLHSSPDVLQQRHRALLRPRGQGGVEPNSRVSHQIFTEKL